MLGVLDRGGIPYRLWGVDRIALWVREGGGRRLCVGECPRLDPRLDGGNNGGFRLFVRRVVGGGGLGAGGIANARVAVRGVGGGGAVPVLLCVGNANLILPLLLLLLLLDILILRSIRGRATLLILGIIRDSRHDFYREEVDEMQTKKTAKTNSSGQRGDEAGGNKSIYLHICHICRPTPVGLRPMLRQLAFSTKSTIDRHVGLGGGG